MDAPTPPGPPPSPIKVFTEPKVYLVGRQRIDEEELNTFLLDNKSAGWQTDTEVGAEVLSEVAGRLCYQSFAKPRPGGNSAYLNHIKEVGHGSVCEHAVWNFIFTGISRSLTHELVRHRAGMAYSQLSQRYVDESDGEYCCPPAVSRYKAAHDRMVRNTFYDKIPTDHGDHWFGYSDVIKFDSECRELGLDPVDQRDQAEIYQHWLDTISATHASYVKLAGRIAKRLDSGLDPGALPPDATGTDRRKYARGAARSVLPNATETKIFVTANARALRHFFEQRGSRHAEAEIRVLANVVHAAMEAESPNLFADYERRPLPDGTVELVTAYRKV